MREMARPASVHAQTVDRLLTAIREEQFAVGSVLPSERALAQQLGVSRNTLREAIRALAHAGALEIRGRSGTVVTPSSTSYDAALRARAEAAGEQSPLDLMVARMAVEPTCAEHAAAQAGEAELEAMRNALERQHEAVIAHQDPAAPDLLFHTAVAGATRNPALIALQGQLAQMMSGDLWAELKGHVRQSEDHLYRYLTHHDLIFDAVQSGDGRRARQLMIMHLVDIEEALLADAT
ncbi:FadR/GntR family transcriptional regulator [Georgenia deserti]|uniref:FadR/GntR family transcriptional regulator n=1 Tax=Georgenia deserti TaxID=2093781 RepID=A0ABW4L6I5_9MICO